MASSGRDPVSVFLLLIVFLCFVGLLAVSAQVWHRAPVTAPPSQEAPRQKQLEVGRALFVARCGRCHDERGDKPLASGPPLHERQLTTEQITRAVQGRFRDKSEEEKAAVVSYIQSFLKQSQSK